MWHFNYRCFYSCLLDNTRPAMPETSLDFVFLRLKSQSEEATLSATLSSLSCLYILANLLRNESPWFVIGGFRSVLCIYVFQGSLLCF